MKWQLLSELLSSTAKLVAVRSSSGAINDARFQCLEALKLAIKLQALGRYAGGATQGSDYNLFMLVD